LIILPLLSGKRRRLCQAFEAHEFCLGLNLQRVCPTLLYALMWKTLAFELRASIHHICANFSILILKVACYPGELMIMDLGNDD
jgi:hypothetical protein